MVLAPKLPTPAKEQYRRNASVAHLPIMLEDEGGFTGRVQSVAELEFARREVS
jgi:hypothetical protein